MSEKYFIPVIKIKSRSVCTYSLPTERPRRTVDQEATVANLTRGIYKGTISDKSRRRLQTIAEGWILGIQEAKKGKISNAHTSSNYITFVTLTLSSKQVHTDNEVKRELLNKFIIYCQRKFSVREYIWRAEAQANGNIHFHLFLDRYIHHEKLKIVWNQVQNTLGYIDRFRSVHGHSNANSTDIQRIRSVKGACIYVSKYISKESKYRNIEGRLWGCSDGLRSIMAFEEVIDSRFSALLNELESRPEIKKIRETNYTVYIGDIRKIISSCFIGIACMLKNHHQDTYKRIYV